MGRRSSRAARILALLLLGLLSACSTGGGGSGEPSASALPTDDRAVLSSASFLRLCAASASHVRDTAAGLAEAIDRGSSDEVASLARDLQTTATDLAGSTEQNVTRLEETAPADPNTAQTRTDALALYARCAQLAADARSVAADVAQDPSAADQADAVVAIADSAEGVVKNVDRFTDQLPKP